MHVEQATFTSAQTHHLQGYHLVARSKGIDEELSRVISVWGPSHASLATPDRNASCLSVFPAGRDHVAFARTTFGGPEYSERGGLQIVTRFLVFRADQLDGFNYDLVAVARLACALGYLYLERNLQERLPTLPFPDASISAVEEVAGDEDGESSFVRDVSRALASNRQVAVVGFDHPESLVEELMRRTPPRHRIDLSFTTGLNPSVHRPFRLHFLRQVDDDLQRRLDDQGVACLQCAAQPVG